MQLRGAAASIRRDALAGISWTAIVSATTSPSFRSIDFIGPPHSSGRFVSSDSGNVECLAGEARPRATPDTPY